MADWEHSLDEYLELWDKKYHEWVTKVVNQQNTIHNFFGSTVIPAFKALEQQLEKHGRKVETSFELFPQILPTEKFICKASVVILNVRGETEFSQTIAVDGGQVWMNFPNGAGRSGGYINEYNQNRVTTELIALYRGVMNERLATYL